LRLPKLLQRVLKLIPAALMVLVVAIGMLRLPISAVDLEAFDAWVWGIAGVATISIAVIGLVASLFVPMAYCRFGCPTGALLDYLRPGSAGWKDVLSVVLVVVSALLLVR
jgi:polyferredoxin